MKRPTVTHLIATNFFGGPEKQIVEHARRLRGDAVEITLLSFLEEEGNAFLAQGEKEGFAARGLPRRHPFDPRQVSDVVDALKEAGTDLLVTHHYKATVVGRLATWRLGLPVVAVSRGWTGESRKIRLYEGMDKFFLRVADRVVAVSEGQKRRVLECGVPQEKVTVIRNCIDCSSIQPPPSADLRRELGLPDDTLLVVSAGRLSPEKNYDGLVRVAARVMEKNSRCAFVVFGEGVLRPSLERGVAQRGLTGRFLLPGFRPDVASLLSQSDIFVLPSFTEGLPNVVLEAFAARRPVVATAVGGTPEVVVEGENGFLVRPDEEEKMAERLLLLLAYPGVRRRLGEEGYRTVRALFSPERQAEEYRALYQEMTVARLVSTFPGRKVRPWNVSKS